MSPWVFNLLVLVQSKITIQMKGFRHNVAAVGHSDCDKTAATKIATIVNHCLSKSNFLSRNFESNQSRKLAAIAQSGGGGGGSGGGRRRLRPGVTK